MNRLTGLLLAAGLTVLGCSHQQNTPDKPARKSEKTNNNPAIPMDTSSYSSLDPKLILGPDNDLPPGISGTQVRPGLPEMYSDVPQGGSWLSLAYLQDGKSMGGVTVFQYHDTLFTRRAFEVLAKGMGNNAVSIGIGDTSAGVAVGRAGSNEVISDLTWMKCDYVVHARVPCAPDEALAYGKRLDNRLDSALCR